MNTFTTQIQKLQNSFAWNSEYQTLDLEMINDAECASEEKVREYASDNDINGDFQIWEDGIKGCFLSDEETAKLEEEYLNFYEAELDRILNG